MVLVTYLILRSALLPHVTTTIMGAVSKRAVKSLFGWVTRPRNREHVYVIENVDDFCVITYI
jgi:hypothetical protein